MGFILNISVIDIFSYAFEVWIIKLIKVRWFTFLFRPFTLHFRLRGAQVGQQLPGLAGITSDCLQFSRGQDLFSQTTVPFWRETTRQPFNAYDRALLFTTHVMHFTRLRWFIKDYKSNIDRCKQEQSKQRLSSMNFRKHNTHRITHIEFGRNI